jgi:hypothetical protein
VNVEPGFEDSVSLLKYYQYTCYTGITITVLRATLTTRVSQSHVRPSTHDTALRTGQMAAEDKTSQSHVSPSTHDTALSTGQRAAEEKTTGRTSEAADIEAGGSVGIGIKPAHRCK